MAEQPREIPELDKQLMSDSGDDDEQIEGGQASLDGAPNATTGAMDRSAAAQGEKPDAAGNAKGKSG